MPDATKRKQDAAFTLRCFEPELDELREGAQLDGRKLGPFLVHHGRAVTRRLRAAKKRTEKSIDRVKPE